MMLKIVVILFLPIISVSSVFPQVPPIGNWSDHLPYHQSINVIHTGKKIWSASPYSIFSIDDQNSIERWSKVNGLSEVGISTIAADEATGKVIIAYNSSNVDVLFNNDVYNVDAIKRSSESGDKVINQIFTFGKKAYLSTGVGIIVIDLEKYEVAETYIIGTNGQKIKVNSVSCDGNFFYAATEEGLKKAPVINANLSDFRNWTGITINGLTSVGVRNVALFGNNILVVKNDSVFISSGNNWNFFYSGGWIIDNVNISAAKVLLCERINGQGRIVVLDEAGNIEKIIQDAQFTNFPKESTISDGAYWIADSVTGLSRWNGNNFELFVPNSPQSIASGEMSVYKKTLWVASGSVNSNWEPENNKKGLYKFSGGTWINYNRSTPAFDSISDFISLAIDPRDESLWAGSFGGGLVNITQNHIVSVYKQNFLQPAYFSPGCYRVSGLSFDKENNLWISNYGANENLLVRKQDGSLRKFSVPFPITENATGKIIIDDANQKWIISPKGNGLIAFSHGLSIDNPSDDQWKWFREGGGNGNLPSSNVLCIAKDKNGFIWVGTDKGIGIIECADKTFSSPGCQAIIPIVQQDNFAGYLFRDEIVQSIGVDGADRKWIGTRKGVWLIGPEGERTIYRFTEENSPLISNDVKSIALDGATGEVFFLTAKGICSFIGTATEAGNEKTRILVFPNPVTPGYAGSIAIRGVADNSIVRITEPDGRLVFQTKSLGGQAIWNGYDYKGKKISSGVYLVLVTDETGKQRAESKIVFIKK